jgi:hypothetical protein
MAMSPLAQRLYDKSKLDLRDFREEVVQWQMANVIYPGTLIGVF